MSSSISAPKFPQFTGSNFSLWKTQVQLHLMHEGVWGIVSLADFEPGSAKEKMIWRMRHDKALGIIGFSLSPHLMHHIDFSMSTNENWSALDKLFGNKMNNSEVYLKKFFDLKMSESSTLHEHLSSISDIIQQLAGISITISDTDKKAMLIKSLEDVSRFKEILGAYKVTRTFDYEEIVATLLEQERTYLDQRKPAFDHGALITEAKKFDQKRKKKKCGYCRKLGHVEERCFAKLADLQKKEHERISQLGTSSEDDSGQSSAKSSDRSARSSNRSSDRSSRSSRSTRHGSPHPRKHSSSRSDVNYASLLTPHDYEEDSDIL